ncbi:MAG: DsbE family thiol:disulfide interchange protein [Gammaproteobacteria bacterium]|nr:DsbE family thiol:disulfide interchange protein [Gammaproteobacteria bacterium]MDH5630424.1 DsbE family thiol:disulfide interchange protein [Gammaproteobacteria bacterium]
MNKQLLWLPFAAFIILGLILYSGIGKDPTKLDSRLIGKAIPAFSKSLLLSDQTITEKDIKGPALINVFASWCPACYSEHPYLMELSAKEKVVIYGLNYKDDKQDALKFIDRLGNPYNMIIFDNNGRLGIDLGVYGAPETFVVDKSNTIVYRHVGEVNERVWTNIILPKMLGTEGQ